MKKLVPALLLGAAALLGSSRTQAQTYQQVWADEFTNGISADWNFETGNGGWGNNEQQYYQRANATVANGILQITAKRENVGGSAYTSSRMNTKGRRDFKFGKMEARMKLPLGQGLWPAFWMLGANIDQVGWPKCGEIDIMEHINAENKVYGTPHWDANGHAEYGGNTTTTPGDWHTYSVEWTPTFIKWFVDGAQYHVIDITNGTGSTEEFQGNFYLLLNLAVGGNWPGQTVDTSKFPATMYVDYVRVYQLTSGSGGSTASTKQLEAEAANTNNGMIMGACSEGGQCAGYIDAGDYLVWNGVNFPTSGQYRIDYRVSSGASGGTISADLNAGSTQLGNTSISGTGSWDTWATVSKTVNVNAGTYNFGVYAQTGGYNLNWVRITKVSGRGVAGTAGEPASVSLYPNPKRAGERVLLELPGFNPEQPATVQVFDTQGREVWRTTATSATLEVAPRLSSGLYSVRITDEAGQHVQKLVVQ